MQELVIETERRRIVVILGNKPRGIVNDLQI